MKQYRLNLDVDYIGIILYSIKTNPIKYLLLLNFTLLLSLFLLLRNYFE
jgi:hypothetical protein